MLVSITRPVVATAKLFGGYITLTPDDGGPVLRVPYAGYNGDYQEIVALTPTAAGFPWLAKVVGTALVNQPDGAVYTLVGGDIPFLIFHLDHQVRRLKAEVVDVATGQSLNLAGDDEYLPRNSTPSGAFRLHLGRHDVQAARTAWDAGAQRHLPHRAVGLESVGKPEQPGAHRTVDVAEYHHPEALGYTARADAHDARGLERQRPRRLRRRHRLDLRALAVGRGAGMASSAVRRPWTSCTCAMVAEVSAARRDEQLALLRAHPDLGSRAGMSEASSVSRPAPDSIASRSTSSNGCSSSTRPIARSSAFRSCSRSGAVRRTTCWRRSPPGCRPRPKTSLTKRCGRCFG